MTINITTIGFEPSTIILSPPAQQLVTEANVQIAPNHGYIRGYVAPSQTANFFGFRDTDGSKNRFTWLVILLNALCITKSAQNILICWNMVIANYCNPDVTVLLIAVDWRHYSTGLTTAIIASLVQSFFIYRYWMLTRRRIICGVTMLGVAFSLVAAILVTVYLPRVEHHRIRAWSLVHFIFAIAVDTLITGATALHLYQQRPDMRSTSELIDRLVRMTWQTALPPTLGVVVTAVVLETRPIELTHLAFNIVLSKLYAISLMYTLNTRNEMRSERASSHEASASTGARITVTNIHHNTGRASMSIGGSGTINTNGHAAVRGRHTSATRIVSFITDHPDKLHSPPPLGVHVATPVHRSDSTDVEMDSLEKLPRPNDDSDVDREDWKDKKRIA
ncbi:SubName: Full=Uncharacterized protein {ECO:0000313/EMBL:CCA74094.1} [Serendipita indica DSM 11827]|nr:SubName: Full=Uncharacterized protein {ECO:0000313/EMBL:CCA74094.1} [Serendipita indica DSM 11827]